MSTALVRRRQGGWVARVAARLVALVRPEELQAGADYGSPFPAQHPYHPLKALSAGAVNPFFFAGLSHIADDLSGLPLYVARRHRDGTVERVDDHPVLDLLRAPYPGVPGVLMRRQMVTDLVSTGNAYLLMLSGGLGRVEALARLHPNRVRVITADNGLPEAYEHDLMGSVVRYPADRVIHMRGPSWQDDPRGVYGLGVVQPLSRDLEADAAAAEASAKASKRGRPDVLMSPRGDGPGWAGTLFEAIRAAVQRRWDESHGGVLILGSGAEVQQLSWAPRDMEYAKQREFARTAMMSGLAVPPVVMGLDTANFATAREQSAQYWQALKSRAALLNAFLAGLASMLGQPGDEVRHDFSGVRALQYDRTERLQRVTQLVMLGADPNEALAYEGFDDAPEILPYTPPQGVPEPEPSPPAEPFVDDPEQGTESRAASGTPLRLLFTRSRRADLASDEQRSDVWRSVEREVLNPATASLVRPVASALRSQAERYAERTRDVLSDTLTRNTVGALAVQRVVDPGIIFTILQSAQELVALSEALSPELRKQLERAYRREARRLNLRSPRPLDAGQLKDLVESQVGYTQRFTEEVVSDVIRRGVADGLSADEIAEQVFRAKVFAPQRAALIARTSAAATATEGTVRAVTEATEQGVQMEGLMWISARDGEVRDTHRQADGTIVQLGQSFAVGRATGPGPGRMSSIEENANCRCIAIGVVR